MWGGTLISRKASIYGAENISIGQNVRIDDFCILSGKIEIGNYVHIAAGVMLFGGEDGILLRDYVGISSRSVIYAASDDYSGQYMTNPTVPEQYRHIISKTVCMEKHVLIDTGCTILPGVRIGEGILNMRKLMILGGSRYALPVIEAAHKLGIYTITCDYLPDNIAHKYSDEYCNVSIIEKEKVLEAAHQLHIDGIMSFACDPGVVTAAYVAEQMGLPNVGPYESVCILQNKGKFREFLTKNGFNVPAAKSYKKVEDAVKDAGIFHWPVIVKPTDSAGSKGVTRVDDPDRLEESIRYALSYSHSDEFIIEDFITQHGYSSDSDSFSVDGELKFVSFDCQHFDQNAENPYTPAAYSWPSSMSQEHQGELTSEIQRLLKLLHMRTAVYNIETREGTDGKTYIMELSPRGGGNRLSECLRYATGVDMITNMVKYSVGMPVDPIEQKPYEGCWAEIILHSDEEGIFKELWISDEIADNVVERDLWIEPGTRVGGFKGANEAIGTLVLQFESQERIEEVLGNQSKYVKVELK